MTEKPTAKQGLSRIQAAFFYSLDGLRYAMLEEAAFRQELMLFILFVPAIIIMPVTISFKGLLLLANFIVLAAELMNSALEAIVDLSSPDYHLLAKRAKDMGSAAVLVAMIAALSLWGLAFYSIC